jgi:uncharacterized protein
MNYTTHNTQHTMDENQDRILEILKTIENEKDITIIYAVDGGSRSYKLHSSSSDYDIRFVFYHNKKTKNFVGYGNDNFVMEYDNKLFEFTGWTLLKTVKHMKESNSTFIEWIHSPLVYIDKRDFLRDSKKIMYQIHNKLSTFYHYNSIAENNYKTWVIGNKDIICKKYVYTVRPILMIIYMETQKENSEMVISDFYELLGLVKDCISLDVYNEILRIVDMKKTRIKTVPRSTILNNWISNELERIDKLKTKKSKKKGDNITGRAISSSYSKLCHEVKKINTISRNSSVINIANYKSVIFSLLRFLWVLHNQDKNISEMTTSLTLLFDQVGSTINNPAIENHIKTILTYKAYTTDTKVENKRNLIKEGLLNPITEFTKVICPSYVFPSREIRTDIYDYLVRDVLFIATLINDPKKSCKTIPWNSLSSKNELIEIDEKLFVSGSNFLRDLKAPMELSVIQELNDWLVAFVDDNVETEKVYRQKIQEIKEINCLERYRQSIGKIDKVVLEDLIERILFL